MHIIKNKRLTRSATLARPLSALELRVARRWYGSDLTLLQVMLARMRSRAGRCFAVVDGGHTVCTGHTV